MNNWCTWRVTLYFDFCRVVKTVRAGCAAAAIGKVRVPGCTPNAVVCEPTGGV